MRAMTHPYACHRSSAFVCDMTQSEAIPIPLYPPEDGHSATFVGRLVRELLLQTDRHSTTFFDSQSAWVDASGKEVVGTRMFALLHRSVATAGMRGVDRLECVCACV